MSVMDDFVVIVGMVCIFMGGLLGELVSESVNELGVVVVKVVLEEVGVVGDDVDQILMGNVLMVGQGQVLGCQVVFKVGMFKFVEVMMLNKMCGFGM